MHGDYIDAIVRTYSNIAVSNPRFGKLSRIGLKTHCKAMCTERFNMKDEAVLRIFFGVAEGQKGYLRAIERCSADKFRPLVSILKKETANPRSEYLELLAWMFDVRPRPFNDKVDYTKIANDPPEPNTLPTPTEPAIPPSTVITERQNDGDSTNVTEPFPVEKPERKWRIITAVLLLLISGLVGFSLLSNNKGESQLPGKGECMYWAGDHYEPSPCIQRGGDTTVIAMDPTRFRNFMRITDTSTITSNSIGKVWYCITNGKFEIYTTKGEHPLDKRNLRRLTQKSYDKYLKSIGR
jgi:hypothetical protein